MSLNDFGRLVYHRNHAIDHGRLMEQVQQFLGGSHGVEFKPLSREDNYEWVESVLRRFPFPRLRRREKGVIRRYIGRMTGYFCAQVSRLN